MSMRQPIASRIPRSVVVFAVLSSLSMLAWSDERPTRVATTKNHPRHHDRYCPPGQGPVPRGYRGTIPCPPIVEPHQLQLPSGPGPGTGTGSALPPIVDPDSMAPGSTPDSGMGREPAGGAEQTPPPIQPQVDPLANAINADNAGQTPALDTSGLATGAFGITAGSPGASPNNIGDFFGGTLYSVRVSQVVSHSFYTVGSLASGVPGTPTASYIFEANGGLADDFDTLGTGSDGSGDGLTDTYAINEPLPPNEVPTSPGAGYTFDGGTVIYTPNGTETTAQNGTPVDGSTWLANYSYSQTSVLELATGGSGSAVRRIKVSESNSPIPRDRLIYEYNFFNDVIANIGDVNRYTVGFEKTFWCGRSSIDFRVPFASTLASDRIIGASPGGTEFGNLSLISKTILYSQRQLLVSAGFGLTIPTADDTTIRFANGNPFLRINNEAVHFAPFVALLHQRKNWYVQSFLQWDIDLSGNSVASSPTGGALNSVGTLHDASLMFVDLSWGYRLYRNPCSCGITSITPTVELHYTTSIEDADSIVASGLDLRPLTNRFDALNLTLGTHVAVRRRLVVSPAVAIPLRRGNNDQFFDFEALVQANYYF